MAKYNTNPPPDELKDMLFYCEGEIYWHPDYRTHQNRTDKPIGTIAKDGYKKTNITINGELRNYRINRLVFWLLTGEWPPVIDHLDRNRANNRIENLRAVTPRQNSINRKPRKNKSGAIGVAVDKGFFRPCVSIGDHQYVGKCYRNIETASLARDILAFLLYDENADLNMLDKEFTIIPE